MQFAVLTLFQVVVVSKLLQVVVDGWAVVQCVHLNYVKYMHYINKINTCMHVHCCIHTHSPISVG